MHRGLLLLLLRAAADDRVVLRLDTAVPPWLLQGEDEAVPLDVTSALPLDPGAAHRHLQSSSDACDYVSVSGANVQTYRHGLYEATGTCDSKPSYECHDCSISGLKIWYHNSNGKWYMGSDGCGSSASGIRIISNDDLEDVSGDWSEWTGSEWLVNSDIAVTCYSYCKEIPGATAKRRCYDCADASDQASVGDGQCDAANNVSPCWDGSDLCGNQILRNVLLNRCVYLHAIDATHARWRGDAGSSPLDGASMAASLPRNDIVKSYCTRHTG